MPPQKAAANGWSSKVVSSYREDNSKAQSHNHPHRKKVVHRKPQKMAAEKEGEDRPNGNIPEVIAVDDFRLAVIKNDVKLVEKFLDQGLGNLKIKIH